MYRAVTLFLCECNVVQMRQDFNNGKRSTNSNCNADATTDYCADCKSSDFGCHVAGGVGPFTYALDGGSF
jgi:hypothetical protein